VLRHDNLTFTPQSIRQCVDFWEGDGQFLLLPLAHVFARQCVSFALLAGTTTTFTRSRETIVEDIKIAGRNGWRAYRASMKKSMPKC